MTYVDGNGVPVSGEAKITGIATKADAVAATTEVAAGTNVASVEKTTDETDKHTIYTVNAKGTEVTGDSNVQVTPTTNNETNVTSYSVKLNDVVNLGSGENKVKIDGNERTVSGLSNTAWDAQGAADGDYKNSTKAATEAQLSAVNTTANKGWSLYITDKDGKQTLVKDVKPTNPLVSIDSGENVSITRNEDGNGLTISADLKDLDVEDTNAVLYDKDTNKTSVTLAGGESGTQIHNLADGTKDTDAVNLGQLTDKTGDLQYNTNHYVTNDEDLTISIGKLDNQVFTNTTNITELQNSTIDSGNVDEKGNINLTHTNADNTTTTIASIDGLKDYALKDGQYITKDKSGATLLTLQDQYDPNNTKTVKIDGLATYNIKTENGEVTGIDYGNIRLAGEIARDPETGEIIIDPKTGKEINTGTRITNLKAGYVGKESTDAVNGSQLYAVQQEAGKHTTVTVNGGVEAPEDGSYTNKDGHLDGNLLLKQTNNDGQIQYDIKLNPDVNLTGEGENSDNRVWLSGSNGTITVTTENNLSEKTTVINGGNVYVGSSVSVGDKVEITDKDITGLSNTSWNGTTDDESRAATEGQLKDVSDTVNAGWTATDSNGNSIVVNPENGSTLNFAGDRNIEVKANEKDGSIDVSLKDDIVLGGKEDTSRVEIGGTNGTIMATKDPNSMAATTTIDGGNVYVGSSISVGDKVEITDKDITGLSNTSWNGTTDDESRAATEGQLKDVSDTVNAGWTATDSNGNSIVVNPENGSTLNFAGDRNIEVKANEKDGSIDVSLKDDIVLGGKEDTSRVEIGGTNGTIMATKDPNSMAATTTIDGGNVYVGSSISVGDKVEITDKDITGLSNTSWNGTTDDESRAATEGQLKDVSDTVNAGWTATDSNGNSIVVNPENGSTLNFAGDRNIEVKANEKDGSIDVSLKDDIVLGGKEDTSRVEIGGTNGTIMATKDPNSMAATTTIDGGNVYVGSSISVGDKVEITDKDITGLSNTEWNGTTTTPDRAATEGQLQDVAIEAAKHTTVSGDKNITVKHEEDSQDYQVTLNDKVYLGGDHTEDSHNIVLDGDRGVIGLGSTIALDGRDGTAVIGGVNITTTSEEETGKAVSTITGLSNTTWEGTTETPDRAATEGQLQSVATEAAKHTTVSGDENITVKHEEGSQDYQVTLNPDVTLKGDNSSIELNGTKGTMQVNQETAEGTNFTNINGNVVSIGYTNSEGIENAIVIDGGKGTITGLSNTTWDDELAKQVANSEELQGTAATQGQLQQAVSEVAEVANAGWNAKAGGNTINVKPNETLNFEGDGNITVSATGGTSNELKFGLNDNITLGDKESTSITLYTDPTSETTVVGTDGNTTNVTGYVPESYKSGTGADFVKNNGGFALFTTDTQGHGIFGVTTKGTAHGKDFVTYTKDIYGNDTRYSLNDVGDAVAQMSSYYNEENRKSYTVFSRYLNEAEKDNPFVTVDEDGNKINATRDIPLALRDDGAVLIGATIKGEDFTDNGIRINAETETTYDEDGNEVTNNIATITGLENTEWKPPTPVATLAANDGSATVTSRAATESQLNDLYSAVAAYDVNVDGTIDYSHIALAGTPYGASRSGNGTHTGGTSITNVAYASGNDGSEAVNVDYLNDAINNAVKDGGAISDSDRHLQEGTYHVNDQGKVELIVADEKGENQSTVTIDNIANKNDITNLDNKIDNTFNDLNDKINNIDNVETDVKGGNINEDGTISLKTENEDGTTTNVTLKGQLTDSGVVQEGTSFDKETGTITITSQDKYSGETSSVKVEGIASTEVVGATNKEDLATAYKDADKDGNATTEYITDSESMVEADVALDHAIQDVAGTSYANDMVLSNRIDSVEKRLGNVEERIDKVGAMAAAIANLRTMGFDPEAPTEIAIGVGQYKSETGIAIGVFHYPNQDFMLSASLSSSGDELMGGIGATWKLGRKSATERAKDEEARHLEQAEEMKKLAQQEKVKAQAQRHAKLLAERQQASQKNA